MLLNKISMSRLSVLVAMSGYALATSFYSAANAADFLVGTQGEYFQVSDSLKPGDKVILANGVWENFEIMFHGEGTEKLPV